VTTRAWLIVRVMLALLAASAVVTAFVGARRRATTASANRYVCPMHPQVSAQGPDACPICGMALVLRAAGPPSAAVHASEVFALGADRPAPAALDVARATVLGVPGEIRAPAWLDGTGLVTAIVHRDEARAIGSEDTAMFVPSGRTDSEVPVRVTADPRTDWDRTTTRLALHTTGAGPFPPAGPGWVQFAPRPRRALVVPRSAILDLPDGAYVMVPAPDRRSFERRRVVIGRVANGVAIVISGLREGEPVMIRGAFTLDAERRLVSATP
jgi:hypothetical protein